MKYLHRISIVILVVICTGIPAFGAIITKSFGPTFEKMSGESKYILDVGTGPRIKSELIFPLDYFMVGGTFKISEKRENRDYWAILINLSTSIKNPSNEFEDYDWYYGDTDAGTFNGMFSSTFHDVKGSQSIISIEGKMQLNQSNKTSFYLWAGYRYQKIKQDDINLLEGSWSIDIQNDPTFAVYEYPRLDDFHGINYEISYSSPFAGLIFNQYPHSNIKLSFRAAGLITSISDTDDHLYRFKKSTANGDGMGFWGEFELKYLPAYKERKRNFFISAYCKYMYFAINAKQTQRWYDDDPFSEIDDTGIYITNIPHNIRSTQIGIGLKLGLVFK